ncbi:uncharacterized protein LOC129872543 [Solanum dulcamara]|uniref:uncharacterized protein LOC129872543 n=1 Tax=Solanum dulcamara TaxID=45834 RepID=UPI002485B850|nr:uncharacterized protein LOC129872543 [Solanum dulcamara]
MSLSPFIYLKKKGNDLVTARFRDSSESTNNAHFLFIFIHGFPIKIFLRSFLGKGFPDLTPPPLLTLASFQPLSAAPGVQICTTPARLKISDLEGDKNPRTAAKSTPKILPSQIRDTNRASLSDLA